MSHQRMLSDASLKVPHSVSLKVLRLSRPQLTQQFPLPIQTTTAHYPLDPSASLAVPPPPDTNSDIEKEYFLSPGLLLPASFGSIFVGSTFTCTLCANNESKDVDISSVKISAEIQLPGAQDFTPLQLDAGEDTADLSPAATLQKIVRAELLNEGVYTLAVTVSYVEGETSRTFRKLYQFTAHQLLGVRTKARVVARHSQAETTRWAIEAQFENLSNNIQTVLESIEMLPLETFAVKGLNNWDISEDSRQPLLGARETLQAMYLITGSSESPREQDGKTYFGQLRIKWRSSSGEAGVLNTGWLGAK